MFKMHVLFGIAWNIYLFIFLIMNYLWNIWQYFMTMIIPPCRTSLDPKLILNDNWVCNNISWYIWIHICHYAAEIKAYIYRIITYICAGVLSDGSITYLHSYLCVRSIVELWWNYIFMEICPNSHLCMVYIICKNINLFLKMHW